MSRFNGRECENKKIIQNSQSDFERIQTLLRFFNSTIANIEENEYS